jgi:hypothetical protein
VTGIGINPPMNPHDRRSGADNVADPWPGYLVGGGWPAETSWVDIQDNYNTNEIAINWQAALVFALAGFVNAGPDAIRNPNAASRALTPAKKNILSRVLPGNGSMTLPAGTVDLYDSKGRRVKRVMSKSRITVNPAALGLGPGIVIIKTAN